MFFSSPSVVNGTVYFGARNAHVYALDAATGTAKWVSDPTEDSVWGSPAVADGVVYIQALAGKIYAFDADTGSLLWSYITKYAEDAKKNGQVSSDIPSLEFSYTPYNLETLKEDIESTNPGIIKVVMDDKGTPEHHDDNLHFVVGKGVSDSTVDINDPWDLVDTGATLEGSYGDKTYRQLVRFIKSSTDLSYLWLYLYSANANILVEHAGQKTGIDENGAEYSQIPGSQHFAEGSITDPVLLNRFGGENSGTKVFSLQKPQSGVYTLTFSGVGEDEFELHAFNKGAETQTFVEKISVSLQSPVTYTLHFDKEKLEDFASLARF